MTELERMAETEEGRRVAGRLRGWKYGWNIPNKPPHVFHRELKNTHKDGSPFRKDCPVCKSGVLRVRREENTFELDEQDYYINCGQPFIYDDIEEMRRADRERMI